MNLIQILNPVAFIKRSPDKESILKLFHEPSLQQLRDDSSAASFAAEKLWSIMNTDAAFDQPLRVSLSILYRKIWGETTPICVAHTVQVHFQILYINSYIS